jgi:hypothetical protein
LPAFAQTSLATPPNKKSPSVGLFVLFSGERGIPFKKLSDLIISATGKRFS